MRASFRQGSPAATEADTLCVGLFEGEAAPPSWTKRSAGASARLIEIRRGEGRLQEDGGRSTRTARRRRARDRRRPRQARRVHARAGARRRARRAGARAGGGRQAHRLGACPAGSTRPRPRARWPRERCWPRTGSTATSQRAMTRPRTAVRRSSRSSPSATCRRVVGEADVVVEHQNAARDLQNLPANDLTPVKLAEHALDRVAEIDGLEVEALGPDEITQRSMGGLLAVAQGSHQEPRFIVLRYDGGGPGLGARGQGRHVRHRRHLDQARGQDAGDEDGHVGRRGRDRGDRGDRAAGAAGQPAERRARDREHAVRATRSSPATSSRSRTARPWR